MSSPSAPTLHEWPPGLGCLLCGVGTVMSWGSLGEGQAIGRSLCQVVRASWHLLLHPPAPRWLGAGVELWSFAGHRVIHFYAVPSVLLICFSLPVFPSLSSHTCLHFQSATPISRTCRRLPLATPELLPFTAELAAVLGNMPLKPSRAVGTAGSNERNNSSPSARRFGASWFALQGCGHWSAMTFASFVTQQAFLGSR